MEQRALVEGHPKQKALGRARRRRGRLGWPFLLARPRLRGHLGWPFLAASSLGVEGRPAVAHRAGLPVRRLAVSTGLGTPAHSCIPS